MFAKVCGLKSAEQIDWAHEYGYDAIGVVVSPKSKRYCDPNTARALAQYAKGKMESFAVAYTLDEARSVREFFDVVQLYEAAEVENLAFSSSQCPPDGLRYRYFVYDASVGSGQYSAFPPWLAGVEGKVVLAGGLNQHNVAEVIRTYAPFGVDVSSGVETDGQKDRTKMREFMSAVRSSCA